MKLPPSHPHAPDWAYTGGRPYAPGEPTVVFVHGALHDHSVWTLAARWCAHHGHRVLAVDLPGHGRSAGPAAPSVEALAEGLAAVLASLGTGAVTLVGHSLGSLIALETAARLGSGAAGLVLVGTAFPMKVAPALLALAADDPSAAIDRVNAWSISTWAAKPAYPGPGHWLHGGNRALMRREQDRYAAAGHGNLFVHDFGLCDAYDGGLAAVPQLRCPVHAVIGERDQLTPPKAAAALLQSTGARVTRLDCGHALMQEAPDGVLEALRAALTAPA